jgi:hypothetical protein
MVRSIENQNWMCTQNKLIFVEQKPFCKIISEKGFEPQYLLQIYDLESHKMHSLEIEDPIENLSLDNLQIINASVNQIIENKSLNFEEFVAYKSIREGKPGITIINVNRMDAKEIFIKTIINPEIIGIYDNWLFYSYQKDPTIKDKFHLVTENLVSGLKIEIGEYILKSKSHLDLAYFNGFVAWSAWTKDTGYDIFYTKLP